MNNLVKKESVKKLYVIEPHPDDALASAAGILFSDKAESCLLTVADVDDVRKDIDLLEYLKSEDAVLRRDYNIVEHRKGKVPDLHWDYRIDNINQPIEKVFDHYCLMYNKLFGDKLDELINTIDEFVKEAVENNALLVVPLALMHPFHILVMECCCRSAIIHNIDKRNISFYIDHPYDYFVNGTEQVNFVRNYIEQKFGFESLHINCTDVDLDFMSEIIKDIYTEEHYGEFDGTLDKTKCSLIINKDAKDMMEEYFVISINNVLLVASQVKPYNKTGGMAEVIYQLAHNIKECANDVRILLFRYDGVCEECGWTKINHESYIYINGQGRECECILDSYEYKGIIYYIMDVIYPSDCRQLIRNDEDEENAVVLCDAFVQTILSNIDYKPTVIHCHDWQAACIPFLIKTKYRKKSFVKNIRTIYTIHFYGYRGIINREIFKEAVGLGGKRCNLCLTCAKECCYFEKIKYLSEEDANLLHVDNEYISCMAAGIYGADYVTTVSEGYADELQGIPDFEHKKIRGIRNGIKIKKHIENSEGFVNIDENNCNDSKLINKRALQRKVGLRVTDEGITPETDKVPLLGMLTRLSVEKGMPDLIESLDAIMKLDVQLLIVGDEPNGKQFYVPIIEECVKKYPGKMSYLPYDEELEYQVYAGVDILLMPSLSEACGTSQMMAMNYGAIPALTMISSFEDTVISYFEEDEMDKGVGFFFFIEDGKTMVSVIKTMLYEFINNKEKWHWTVWKNIVTRFFWKEGSVKKYLDLYDGDVCDE